MYRSYENVANMGSMDCQCPELPIAYAYVPPQQLDNCYAPEDAIIRGTLFPELDLPFKNFEINRPLPDSTVSEMRKYGFLTHEMRLFLNTHPDDKRAQGVYEQYKNKAEEAKMKYEAAVPGGADAWVYGPWPWEGDM